MADNYYQSAFEGKQIDDAIGRIVNGELDQLAKDASTSAAEAEKAKAGAQSALTGVQQAIDNIPEGETPIVNDLTTGGATMALSAEMGKVLGRRPNHNLLDNWYFADPVDHRGGYVVPPGTVAYTDSALTSEYGTISGYRAVVERTSTYCRWIGTDGSISYYAPASAAVRGYTGTGYGIDRWRIVDQFNGDYVTISGDGLGVGTGGTAVFHRVVQPIEGVASLRGKTLTYSVLIKSVSDYDGARGAFGFFVNGAEFKYVRFSAPGLYSMTITVPEDTNELWVHFGSYRDRRFVIEAAKLELGTEQTLAHQDASGAWVLNEIPDKSEELLKCCMSTADPSDDYANNKKTAAAVGAVAQDGSNAMTGPLTLADWGGGTHMTQLIEHGDSTHIRHWQDDSNYISLFWSMAQDLLLSIVKGGVQTNYAFLHTGNKPSGFYTGNGSDATREINIGNSLNHGIIGITAHGNKIAFVAINGGVGLLFSSDAPGPYGFGAEAVRFDGGTGKLILNTADQLFNQNGTSYEYFVL